MKNAGDTTLGIGGIAGDGWVGDLDNTTTETSSVIGGQRNHNDAHESSLIVGGADNSLAAQQMLLLFLGDLGISISQQIASSSPLQMQPFSKKIQWRSLP